MSVTNDLVYSLIQSYFPLDPFHCFCDSISNSSDVPEEAPGGGEILDALFHLSPSLLHAIFIKEWDSGGDCAV